MDRRGFLWTTAGGALGMAAASGCGATQHRVSNAEANALLARLDHGLGSVRGAQPMLGHRHEAADEVARLGLEALIVADVARTIPVGAEIPDALAERLHREMPVLDRSTETYLALASGLAQGSRRRVEERLHERPEAAMEVAAWIDEQAAEHAIAYESRVQLRRLATNITRRTRRQSMSAVIDDTVQKVERVAAHHGPRTAMARQAGTQAMLASIWQSIEGVPPGGVGRTLGQPNGGETKPPLYGPDGRPIASTSEAPPEPEEQGGPGDPELAVGAVMMGLGPVVFGISVGIGALAGSAAWGAIIGATPGGTLILVGLIVLLVGVAQNA